MAQVNANERSSEAADELLDRLVLSAPPETRGRARLGQTPSPPIFEFERELTGADLELLGSGRTSNVALSVSTRIKNISHRHHLAARLIADGQTTQNVAYATAYSPSFVSILKADPAFQELVQHYHGQKVQVYLDVHQRLGALGMTAVDEIQERLDDPEQVAGMTNKTLLEIAEMALERSIAPKKSGGGAGLTVNAGGAAGLVVNLNFAEPDAHAGRLIDVSPTQANASTTPTSDPSTPTPGG